MLATVFYLVALHCHQGSSCEFKRVEPLPGYPSDRECHARWGQLASQYVGTDDLLLCVAEAEEAVPRESSALGGRKPNEILTL
jgi:hypothetical protein